MKTLTSLIEAHCKKYSTVWLHKDDIEPIVKEWLELNKKMSEKDGQKIKK